MKDAKHDIASSCSRGELWLAKSRIEGTCKQHNTEGTYVRHIEVVDEKWYIMLRYIYEVKDMQAGERRTSRIDRTLVVL